MRCAIISDVHANIEALNAVLQHCANVDAIYCCGDVAGYGASPNDCCELVRNRCSATVLGNHDAAAAGLLETSWFNPAAQAAAKWTASALTPKSLLFLQSLPASTSLEDFRLFHGTLKHPDSYAYITNARQARDHALAAMGDCRLGFFGHTHIAEYYVQREGSFGVDQISMVSGGTIELKPGFKYIVNCGSVGQPRDGNPKTSFALYDAEAEKVEILRIPYDVTSAQRRITEAGLPKYLADRLAIGR